MVLTHPHISVSCLEIGHLEMLGETLNPRPESGHVRDGLELGTTNRSPLPKKRLVKIWIINSWI
jgi:hypothetical protein